MNVPVAPVTEPYTTRAMIVPHAGGTRHTAGAVPFFDSTPLHGETRRVLLLSHHFPPSARVGALRWRKLLSHLAERGWGADVITTAPKPDVPDIAGLMSDLPAGLRVWGVTEPDAVVHRVEHALYRVYRRFQGSTGSTDVGGAGMAVGEPRPEALDRASVAWNLGTPRGYARLWFTFRHFMVAWEWSRRVVRLAMQVADPAIHSAIISSGPPHHWHNAARVVAARTGIPFVMDLRDPWAATGVVHEYFATPPWIGLTRRQECSAVRHAAFVIANTDTLRTAMASAHPHAAERIITVMNGYDVDPLPEPRRGSCFTIGYAGSIYHGRDPAPLFAGAAAVIRRLRLSPDQLQVRLIGEVQGYGGVPVAEIAARHGIADYVSIGERAPQAEAWQFMADCHVLVSLPWEDNLTIPAKLFEYMRFSAWLLVFARADSAITQVLRGSGADVVGNDDAAGVARAIEKRYLQHAAGEQPLPLATDERLSRRAQASLLHTALEQWCGPALDAAAGVTR
jgi:glycosyltransferase involved in cell wall biosynthesis